MKEFQRKNNIKKMIYSRSVLALVLIILFFFVKATIDFYQKASESKKRKERAETELLELQKRKENLENKIQSLSSPVGVEKELREKFDLVKEGEETILIGDGKGTSSGSQ
jgi:cell division protein FtsB